MNSEIEEDLIKRDVRLAAVIVQNNEGQFQLISYDGNNNANFITDFVDVMDINERLEGRMIRPMATIQVKKK